MSDLHDPTRKNNDSGDRSEFGVGGGGAREMKQACPLCGADSVYLRTHLPDCEVGL